ncbi:YrrS family protein [Bacillus sp. B15-48]|uniref:YrrS family protein n=1 Tax=Bacillus sp. B15-48 TaxID=1548601 RepID=UPI00193F66A2|nr:YrrS family protein [Bacillus sp. B15-48]MBM4762375.1 DUF1510 family protein [Bacillus sp. B15-48]
MLNNDSDRSRAEKLAKRRKTNLILNGLIVLVLLLIIFVSVNIFFGDGQSEVVEENTAAEQTNDDGNNLPDSSGNKEVDEVEDQSTDIEKRDDEDNNDVDHKDEETEPIVTEGGSSPDVKRTIVDPTWKPVGTTQSGEHTAVYDSSSVDWQEMLKAISYATGIDVNQMTVWFLGNNGGPQSAAGTVSEKGGTVKFRVAIEWVDNEGWMPVKVEELNS